MLYYHVDINNYSITQNSDVGISILTVRAADADGDTPTYTIISGKSTMLKLDLASVRNI